MAKDPAFLFYPNDWLGGTMTFSRHLKGCYIDLLIAQFNSGPLSLEEIRTILGSDFASAWDALRKKFAQDAAGKFFNERLLVEKLKRENFLSKQVENGRLGGRPKKPKENPNLIPNNNPKKTKKENRNRNRNEVENGIRSESAQKIILPFDSETFIRAWEGWKEYKQSQHKFSYHGKHSEQIALKRLSELSKHDENIALEIIEQSIANGWQGLFEIKTKINGHGHTKESIIRESDRQAAEIIKRGNPYARKES